MNIVGWERIIPQLGAFFAILKRRPNSLTPFNLFLTGKPGTNKSEGILYLAQELNLAAALQDSSTLDDVSELAGIIDLKANREQGQAKLIEGDRLKVDLLVLDEFLNTRPHVVPQFRLLLQGRLALYGKDVDMNVRSIIGTGNLSDEMEQGDANVLDTPTADRFAMIVQTPSLSDMSAEEVAAVLEGGGSDSFVKAFKTAVSAIDTSFEAVSQKQGGRATRYVQALLSQLTGTPFAFEGRRGKLLRLFVLAAMALAEAQNERDRDDTIWQVVRDCLSFHRLSGITLDMTALETAHKVACQSIGDASIEAEIVTENVLANKLTLLIRHRSEVSPLTKADVFSKVVASKDVPLQLACQQLVRSSQFEGEPAELRAFLERIQFAAEPAPLDASQMLLLSKMSATQAAVFQLSKGSKTEIKRLTDSVNAYLEHWGISETLTAAA